MADRAFLARSAALTFAIYWLCLRFLYPTYFAPLSPFYPDSTCLPLSAI